MDRETLQAHNQAKESIKDLLYGTETLNTITSCGTPRAVPSTQDTPIFLSLSPYHLARARS